jgi:hypothetical protein
VSRERSDVDRDSPTAHEGVARRYRRTVGDAFVRVVNAPPDRTPSEHVSKYVTSTGSECG